MPAGVAPAVENVIEKTPRFLRPPGGRTSPTIARIADQLDLTIVGGSATASRGADVRDGSIVVVEGAPGVSGVMERVAAKNLRITTLEQWAADPN